jgi:hypothetical protein
VDTLTIPRTITRRQPTQEEARDWRKLALTLDAILRCVNDDEEPPMEKIHEAKRLRAKLGVA